MENAGNKLTANKKMALAGLVFFGLVIIFFWLGDLKNSLSRPFLPTSPMISSGEILSCSDGSCLEAEESNLRVMDTDKDSLSDWDELNTYGTSPYLEDTDSDGVNDRQEIISGANPNCLGEDCGFGEPITDPDLNIGEEEADLATDKDLEESGISIGETEIKLGEGEMNDMELLKLLGGESDASALREALAAAGMGKEVLDKLSDQDLMSLYQDSLNNYDQ
jgi:hypothetical protein